ncbi:MAG: hypothetical protein M1822_001112 [Bathelium mastoideum]|nr:MAG: hypothetical protein M1822_001112 [Bathelium mastoideum]
MAALFRKSDQSQKQEAVGPKPPDNPYSWSPTVKLIVSFGNFLSLFSISFGNSAYIGSIIPVQAEFRISDTLAIAPISLYSIGFVCGPMLGSALSEVFGRQYVYKTAMILCLVFTIVAGTATHFRTLAVARAFAGFLGSPAITVLSAMQFDLYAPGDKMGELWKVLSGIGVIWATELGPFAGGDIVQDRGWRWSFYLTAILLGACLLIMLPVRETFLPEIVRKHNKSPRPNLGQALKTSFWRPLHMMLVEPIMLPTSLFVAWSQTILFVFYVAYPYILVRVYSFSLSHVGLSFLPLFVGTTLAVPVLGIIDKRVYQVEVARARANGELPTPEARLFPSKIGAMLIPVALFWLGWTARSGVHWAAPVMSGLVYGFAFAFAMLSIPIYKGDVYGPELGASAFAIDTAARYLLSSPFPLFTVQMINGLGFEWAMSLLAFISLIFVPVPWLIAHYGPALRARSHYVKNLNREIDMQFLQSDTQAEGKPTFDSPVATQTSTGNSSLRFGESPAQTEPSVWV